jgi:uncharacterized membrane protein YgcG
MRFVDSWPMMVLILASVGAGLYVSVLPTLQPVDEPTIQDFFVFECVVCVFYVFECCARCKGMGISGYLCDIWCLFDLFITLVDVASIAIKVAADYGVGASTATATGSDGGSDDVMGYTSSLRVIRFVRLVRFLRILRVFRWTSNTVVGAYDNYRLDSWIDPCALDDFYDSYFTAEGLKEIDKLFNSSTENSYAASLKKMTGEMPRAHRYANANAAGVEDGDGGDGDGGSDGNSSGSGSGSGGGGGIPYNMEVCLSLLIEGDDEVFEAAFTLLWDHYHQVRAWEYWRSQWLGG